MSDSSRHDSDKEMRDYYRDRAPVYDEVYAYPERQDDLRFLEEYIPSKLKGLDVLEVAAGTGYWSQFIAQQAHSLLATDATAAVLAQLKDRRAASMVEIEQIDAYSLTALNRRFSGAFAGLWISHVPKQRLSEFLFGLHSQLQKGSTVIFIDNSVAQCDRLPLSYTDSFGNTYQDRVLANNQSHRVLKNFPSEGELFEAIADVADAPQYQQLDNFWLLEYTLK